MHDNFFFWKFFAFRLKVPVFVFSSLWNKLPQTVAWNNINPRLEKVMTPDLSFKGAGTRAGTERRAFAKTWAVWCSLGVKIV